MRRPLSLALRLTLLFGGAAVVIFPVFGWVISQMAERHFFAEDTRELQVIAGATRDVLSDSPTAGNLSSLNQRFADILVGHHDASLFIARQNGPTLYASPGPDLSALARVATDDTDDPAVRRWRDAQHHYRALIESVQTSRGATDGSYILVVAVPIDREMRFLAAFRRTLWIMIAASIAVTALMGWIAVRQGHGPLHDIVARMHRISAHELSVRLNPESMPAELAELAVSFNEMIQRVDESFHQLSNFNADIAHELRTPITNLMTQTQVALARARTVDEYREILYSNMEEYERLARMVSDMLFLAQTDNSRIQNIDAVDLTKEVQVLFDFYEGWAEERGVMLAMQGDATVSGDRLMLQRALGNLLSNAIRHTPAGGTVLVEVQTSGDDIHVVVENPGPEISPEQIPRLFDRFHRIEASRQSSGDGAGLGLAIVKSIADAHEGKVTVSSSGGLTRFCLILPRGCQSGPVART